MIISEECPGPEWKKGLLGQEEAYTKRGEKLKGCKRYNNGTVEKMFREDPGEGWALGPLPETKEKIRATLLNSEDSTKGKTCYNNGKIMKYFDEDPSGEWVKGMLKDENQEPGNKGLICWNNGKISKYSKTCPGEGWVKGRLAIKIIDESDEQED